MPRRLKITVVTLAILTGVSLVVYDCGLNALWSGRFPLTVHLRSKDDREIIRVSARAVMAYDWETYLRLNPDPRDLGLEPVQWVAGQSFGVRVPCGGRTSGFGRELSYHNFRVLILRIEYGDGTSEYVISEIPDGRRQREVFVTVP